MYRKGSSMLNALRKFSWLLLISGVIGFVCVVLGIEPGIGSRTNALAVIGIQVVIASLIFIGFKLNSKKIVTSNALLYGGWILIAILMVIVQYWVNTSVVNI